MGKTVEDILGKEISKIKTRIEQRNPIPEDDVISPQLKTVIQILCFLGSCPLSVKPEGQNKRFAFKLLSYRTLFSFLAAAWVSWIWILYVADFLFKSPIGGFKISKQLRELEHGVKQNTKFSESQISTSLLIIFAAHAVLGISRFHGIFYGWRNVKLLETFLNNWTDFHEQIYRTFLMYLKDEEQKKCEKYTRGRLFKVFSRVMYFMIIVLPVTTNLLVWSNNPDELDFVRLLFAATSMISIITVELLEDLKACLLFTTVIKAFRMVKSGIQFTVTWQAVDESTVSNWREVITMVRSQSSKMNDYLAPRQVALVLETIVVVTSFIYMLASNDYDNPQNIPHLIIWTNAGLILLFRMSVKTYVAEKITKTEADLATYISLIRVKDTDTSTLIQLKFTHDLISNNPTVVVFGDVLIFNRSVVLTIFNQVVTYMIVLMQFSQK